MGMGEVMQGEHAEAGPWPRPLSATGAEADGSGRGCREGL